MLDTRTVAVMVVLMLVVTSAVHLVNWRIHPQIRGGGWWFAGSMVQVLGVVLLMLRGQVPDLLSIVAANAALIAGLMLLAEGTARFAGVRATRGVFVAAAVGVVAGFLWFTYIDPSLVGRWWVFGVCTALCVGQSLRAQWRVAQTEGWLGAGGYMVASLGVVAVMLATPAALSRGQPGVARLYEDSAAISWGLALFAVLVTMQCIGRVQMTANRIQRELERLALVDSLTGLPNRRAFDDALERDAAAALRSGSSLGLLLLDIDHFKRINDTHGHPEGDAVLRQIADRLSRACRQNDFPARVGGEEFAVILHSPSALTLREVGERVRRAVADQPLNVAGRAQAVTVSVGGAMREDLRGEDRMDLYGLADQALYAAKQGGRNRVELAPHAGPG